MSTIYDGMFAEESGSWWMLIVANGEEIHGELRHKDFTCEVSGRLQPGALHISWTSVFSFTNRQESGSAQLTSLDDGETLAGRFTIFGQTRDWRLRLAVTDEDEVDDSQGSPAQPLTVPYWGRNRRVQTPEEVQRIRREVLQGVKVPLPKPTDRPAWTERPTSSRTSVGTTNPNPTDRPSYGRRPLEEQPIRLLIKEWRWRKWGSGSGSVGRVN